MLVCRETDSLGCVNCVEKGWNKMENKVTVVLADANEEFRTMLRQRMEGTGEFHVAGSTENGDQALDLVRRLRPQLLVTDVVLPGPGRVRAAAAAEPAGPGRAPDHRGVLLLQPPDRGPGHGNGCVFLPAQAGERGVPVGADAAGRRTGAGGGSLCPSSGGDGDRHHSRDRRPGTHQGIPVPTGGHHDRGE